MLYACGVKEKREKKNYSRKLLQSNLEILLNKEVEKEILPH